MENKLVKFASKVSTPLSLASLVIVILYVLFKVILQLGIFSTLEEDNTFTLINSIVDKIFYLAIFALALGVLAYIYKLTLPQPTNIDAEYLKKELNISSIRRSLYAEKQLKAYHEVWIALVQLDEAGDKLWSLVNKATLNEFGNQLEFTAWAARRNEILFEETHFKKLDGVFRAFKNYLMGKIQIKDLYSKTGNELDELLEEIKKQVEQNRQYKETYKTLKEDIGDTFRRQLSGK